jgi:phosphate starvation-inducible protein PhoH and related proteins
LSNHHADHWKSLQEADVLSRIISPPQFRPKELVPKTDNHKAYYDAVLTKPLTLCVGCAGTSKSWTAIGAGVKELLANKFERLVIVRPMVECGRRLGAMPGEKQDKLAPYLEAAMDILADFLSPEQIHSFLALGKISLDTFETLRGKTFHRSYVVLDESQNADEGQLLMFLTRAGQGTRLVVNGDDTGQQNDLGARQTSGLDKAWRCLNHPDIAKIRMTKDDIMRSGLVRTILELWEADGQDSAH